MGVGGGGRVVGGGLGLFFDYLPLINFLVFFVFQMKSKKNLIFKIFNFSLYIPRSFEYKLLRLNVNLYILCYCIYILYKIFKKNK